MFKEKQRHLFYITLILTNHNVWNEEAIIRLIWTSGFLEPRYVVSTERSGGTSEIKAFKSIS